MTKTPFNESEAAFSPDGYAIAYTSDESGRSEIYVRAFPIDARRTDSTFCSRDRQAPIDSA